MRILHLVSNHKLTGPVDPAIRLASALREIGVESEVAVGRPELGPGPIDDLVRERGLEPVTALRLPKHRRFFANRHDVGVLVERLGRGPVDVLHAHLDNAHRTAVRAARRLPVERRPRIVRTLYDDAVGPASGEIRSLYAATTGVFVFGDRVRDGVAEELGVPRERIRRIEGAVVTERFRPRSHDESLRDRLELPQDAVVAGIVARIQPHRRYELLFEAVREVMAEQPNFYLLVLGRGTRAQEIAHESVRALGIEERVRLPGYIGGDDYPRALACFDFKIFLVPGSDGTCRAVREAMATGVPVIASRRGLLPEMIRDGVDGILVEETTTALTSALLRLAADAEYRRELGANALSRARSDFCQTSQARSVLDAYRDWSA